MADEVLKRDQNNVTVLGGVTDDSNQNIEMLRVDPTTKRLLVSATGLGGGNVVGPASAVDGHLAVFDGTTGKLIKDGGAVPAAGGTVTSVSVVSTNGFAGTVATATTTPAITLTTTITGVLKGNGTAISSATDGSDYLSSTTGVTLAQGSAQTIGTTTNRVLKLWATDITVTNAITGSITGNAATVTTNANLTGVITSVGNATSIASQTGTGTKFVVDTSPTLVTPLLGTPTSGVLTNCTGLPAASVVAGTLGTGAYVMDTKLTVPQVITTNNAIAASGNAATVPVTSKVNTVTNNSAATLTITLTTAGAVDRQICIVCILDSSAAAQTITWANTENSTVTAPTTSNGSTTLPLTVGFMYNNATSKWRCVASC